MGIAAPFSLLLRGESDFELARLPPRRSKKHLVEIAQAEKIATRSGAAADRCGMPHQRRGGVSHLFFLRAVCAPAVLPPDPRAMQPRGRIRSKITGGKPPALTPLRVIPRSLMAAATGRAPTMYAAVRLFTRC